MEISEHKGLSTLNFGPTWLLESDIIQRCQQIWNNGLDISKDGSTRHCAKEARALNVDNCSIHSTNKGLYVSVNSQCPSQAASRKAVYIVVKGVDLRANLLRYIVLNRNDVAVDEGRCGGS
ncbi:hypothetical protein V499_07635 [Pseudogymnoascus sp. VKM F-103]|nr:hypothetical protein V499_07635 [Pseudogymnoascus sp. VKM F-103]